MSLSENDFNQIISIITKCSGIIPLECHKPAIHDYIQKRLEQIQDFEPIVKFKFLLEQDKNELAELINVSIQNKSYFFRDEKHFSILEKKIFPEWQANHPDSNINIWSAGCSSGEEAYSLAVLAYSCQITPTITASDISTSSLNTCTMGVFSTDSKRFDDGAIFHNLLMPYLTENNKFSFTGEIRSLIHTKQINLTKPEDYKLPAKQDIIFLRNVLIYFNDELTYKILKNITTNYLADGGFLFLSQKEAVSFPKEILPENLKKITFGETVYFCKR